MSRTLWSITHPPEEVDGICDMSRSHTHIHIPTYGTSKTYHIYM